MPQTMRGNSVREMSRIFQASLNEIFVQCVGDSLAGKFVSATVLK